MRRRQAVLSAVSRGLLILTLCAAGTACSRSDAGVRPSPEPVQPAGSPAAEPGPIRVPDLYGLTQQEAVARLKQAGLTPEVKNELSFDFKLYGMHCRVLAQSPLPGNRVAAGTRVVVTVYVPVGTCP